MPFPLVSSFPEYRGNEKRQHRAFLSICYNEDEVDEFPWVWYYCACFLEKEKENGREREGEKAKGQ